MTTITVHTATTDYNQNPDDPAYQAICFHPGCTFQTRWTHADEFLQTTPQRATDLDWEEAIQTALSHALSLAEDHG